MTDSAPIMISMTYAMPCETSRFARRNEHFVSARSAHTGASSRRLEARGGWERQRLGNGAASLWNRSKWTRKWPSAGSQSPGARIDQRTRMRRPASLRPMRLASRASPHPVSKSPAWGGASGVNRHRSGLRSTSGVLSRQSRPLTRSVGPWRSTRTASAVPIGFGRTGERSANVAARLTVIGRALAHEIAARFMQPIEDLDPLERLDPVQRRDPGLGDLDAADRAVRSPLARTFEARRPGRADDADEREAGVERSGRFDRDLVTPDFVQPDHDPDALVGFKRLRSRATSSRPPCRSPGSTGTRHASSASRTWDSSSQRRPAALPH